MKARWSLVLASVLGGVACGSDDAERPSQVAPNGGRGGSGGAGATAGNQGGRSQGGTSGKGSSGGARAGEAGEGGADGGSTICGNDELEADEECEAGLVPSCESFGYGPGEVECGPGCRADTSACERVERCADGRDNDDDGTVDCGDADCAAACASVCSAPEVLVELESHLGSNAGRSASLALSCASEPSGAAVAYQLTAAQAGMLEVTLQTAALLNVSIRSDCSRLASESACGLGNASARVEANESVFIIVQGLEAGDVGEFTLHASTRAADVCGDGVRDGAERCDDGNLLGDDGCGRDCQLESSELEPNAVAADASVYTSPFFGEIYPAEDVDIIHVEVAADDTTLTANVLNLGDGACANEQMDSVIELLSSTEASIARDDDGGDGYCSRLVVTDLAAGSYYLVVRAAAETEPPTFPYRLAISTDVCGNGVTGPAEECDDGNITAGDGCDASCLDE